MNPAYKTIGYSFKIGKNGYFGKIIASASALYLIMAQHKGAMGGGVAAVGGLVGGLIAAAVSAVSGKTQPVHTCLVYELESEVLDHPDWPLANTAKHDEHPVLVVPRGNVELLDHPRFSNLIRFEFGLLPVAIEYALFRGGAVRDYLVDAAWPVRWKGIYVD